MPLAAPGLAGPSAGPPPPSVVATTSLPGVWNGMPWARQKSLVAFSPARHSCALSEPGRVVDARVDHAGVVAALVRGEAVLLLQHHHRGVRAPLEQGQGGGQPDDAAADDGVLTVHAAAPLPPSVAWGPQSPDSPERARSRRRSDSSRDAPAGRPDRWRPRRRGRTPPRRGCSRGGTARCPGSRSGKCSMIRAGSTWARPKERTPGVSMTQPSSPGRRERDRRASRCAGRGR